MNLRLALVFSCCLFTVASLAQQFGGFPPRTKWRQISSDTARIIFEQPVDSQAQNIAAIIHQLARINPNPLGDKVRRISVVLHKNTTLANGYVALGPFRSEYFLIPGSNIFEFGSTPWQQTLAVHENRHVHQYANFNRGVSRLASVLFGQEGQAAFNAISIPDWFFEGDAVHTETIQTYHGRGRAPEFFNGFRALWRDGRDYKWAKLRNGSLKDYVPNHYPLGYLLVNYGYQNYGADFWQKVTSNALSLRGFFGLFGGSVKRYSGKRWPQFRSDALEYYRHQVSTRRDAIKNRETVTDYLFAQQIGKDSLLYTKQSYRRLPAFYLQDSAGEHRLKLRNITNEDWFSYRNGVVAYTAYNTSARWSLRNYSDIILLNITLGSEREITHRGKYFTPDFNNDGSQLVAVSFNDSLGSELHLLSADGKILQVIKPKRNDDLFVHPRFDEQNRITVAVRHGNSTMSMQRLTLNSETVNWETLIDPQMAILGYPMTTGNRLYFVSSASGNDDVYALDLSAPLPARRLQQLTFGQTGNYWPTVLGDTLIWSNFTSNGYRLQKTSLSALRTVEISGENLSKRAVPFSIALQEAPNVLASSRGSRPEGDYSKATGLFNFHSYRPNFSDPEITYSLYSDNVLNTFSNEVFYRYNINETSHGVGFNTFYGALFPVLTAGVNYTFDRTVKTTALTYSLNQLEARGGYYIPLNFTSGNTYKLLNFGGNFVYNELKPTASFRSLLRSRTSTYLHHFITYTQQLPAAVQHIYPKFAYTVNLQHRHLLKGSGFQSLASGNLYLPSIANHSIVVGGSIQETDTANITFSNRFANSRGYNDYYFSRMWRFSGNYHFPLFYPDAGFPGIIYLLRVRANGFYDYSRVYSNNKLRFANQRSAGGELYFDTKLFNSLRATIGVRFSHLLDNDFSSTRPKGTNRWDIIIPLDLIPQ